MMITMMHDKQVHPNATDNSTTLIKDKKTTMKKPGVNCSSSSLKEDEEENKQKQQQHQHQHQHQHNLQSVFAKLLSVQSNYHHETKTNTNTTTTNPTTIFLQKFRENGSRCISSAYL